MISPAVPYLLLLRSIVLPVHDSLNCTLVIIIEAQTPLKVLPTLSYCTGILFLDDGTPAVPLSTGGMIAAGVRREERQQRAARAARFLVRKT